MRRLAALCFAALLCTGLGACASTPKIVATVPIPPAHDAWIVGGDGRAIGQARFLPGPHGVLIRLEFREHGLPPGWHAVHLHQTADCTDFAAGFRAAGDHVGAHRHVAHGLLHPQGSEAGDLTNIFAAPAGPFAAEIYSDRVVLGPEEIQHRAPLLDADGSALIIHMGADDQITQPIGNAGPRIGCAALKP